jgi:hypothetical protein
MPVVATVIRSALRPRSADEACSIFRPITIFVIDEIHNGDALQRLMQHKDYQTTQRYISTARQVKPAAQNLFVPSLSVAAS